MFKNIIFDWSGVVNDNVQDVYNTANEMITRVRGQGIAFEEFRSRWVSPYMEFYIQFLPDLTVKDQAKFYLEIFPKYCTNKPFRGMVNLLREFHLQGKTLVLQSSDHPSYLHDEIASFGLTHVFEEVYSGVHDKRDIVKKVMQTHNFKKIETLFVGDTQNDDQAGKHAGIKTALVTWGFCDLEKIETTNPDYIINNPQELRQIIADTPKKS